MEADGARPLLRVDVLGPLRLVVDEREVDVPGPKRRALLALLALAEGRSATADHLVDALWPAEAPGSGRQALHSHVSRLRGHLGPAADRLRTGQEGYRLHLDAATLDLAEARSLVTRARARQTGDPSAAYTLLRRAHALWRGPVLADLTDVAPIAAAAEGCERLRREVVDALVAAGIAAGQADTVLGLAADAAGADPLREPAVLLLMRALAATGQTPEALRAGREFRTRLADETGLDPSPALGDLERDIAGGAAGPAPSRRELTPRPATRLIGREAQVAALHRLLTTERLVTIVGPGGVGKTRVALEIAHQSPAATVLPLAPVTDPVALPHALAAALNLTVVHGGVLAACLAVLGDRPCLLVVDNCEHVLDGARDVVTAVLATCPRVTVLATSREPLGLAAEYGYRLLPLPLPGRGEDQDLARVPAVAVFVDRARRVRPAAVATQQHLRTVADIVRRLDGMPLAIELAAGRLSGFSLTDLHDRLDRSLDLLGGGLPSGDGRHRTLRATVEWSYRLLEEDERRLFRHLAVFADGLDLEAAERLAAQVAPGGDPGSLLARLVDASMIEVDFGTVTRFRMLQTLRAFGLDRLAADGESDAAAETLLGWAADLATAVGTGLAGEREPEADALLRREMGNLRAAWQLARQRGSLDHAVQMVCGLFDAISYRDLVELRGWAGELAADPAVPGHPRGAVVLGIAAEAAYQQGDHAGAERLARAGLELAGARGGHDAWCCLLPLAVVCLARGAFEDVVTHSLAAAQSASPSRECFGTAALAAAYAGDHDRARALNEKGIAEAVSPSMRGWGAYVAGEIENLAGRCEQAEENYLRAVDLARSAGATFLAGVASVGLLTVRADAGRIHEALTGYREVVDYFARTGNWTHLWATLRNLADLLRRLGDDRPADLLDAAADGAPDAPADDRVRAAATSSRQLAGSLPAPAGRAAVLELARAAIERNLARPGPFAGGDDRG